MTPRKPDTDPGRSRRAAADWALILIAVVAVCAALRFAGAVFQPILLALVFGVVLSPLSNAWERAGLPRTFGAISGLLVTLVAIVAIVFALEPLVRDLIRRAPVIWSDIRETVLGIRQLILEVERVSETVSETVAPGGGEPEAEEETGVRLPTVADALFMAPAYAAQALIFVGTLFFFMLSRFDVYEWASRMIGPDSMTGEVAHRLHRAEVLVSRYFLTILMINATLGVVVALGLSLIGLPSAFFWGLVAGLLNFILYLGPALMTVALLLAGIGAFDGTMVLLPPAIYVTINMMEANFVTPTLVGRNMRINPLLVFLALVFWLWLWGPVGGFVAIPLLVWVMAVTRWPQSLLEPQTISGGTKGRGRPKRSAGPGS